MALDYAHNWKHKFRHLRLHHCVLVFLTFHNTQALEGEPLIFIVALRNVLAHSAEAKLAALRTRLHTALLHTCVVAVQALEAAAARPSHPAAASTSSRAGSAAPSRRTTAPNTPAARGRVTGRASAGGLLQTEASGSAGVQHPWERPTPLAMPASPSRSVAATAAPSMADKRAEAAVPLLRHPALEKKVTVALSLLKHLAYRSVHTRGVLLREGVFRVLQGLWKHGFGLSGFGGRSGPGGPSSGANGGMAATGSQFQFSGEAKQHVTASAALHEALGLITNMLPSCASARSALAEEGSPTLLQSVLVLMFEVRLHGETTCVCLASLACSAVHIGHAGSLEVLVCCMLWFGFRLGL